MAKDNYTQLSNLEIIEIIDGLGIGTMGLLRYLKNRNPELVQEIVQRTQFLPEKSKLSARLHCIRNNISSAPKCQRPGCNKGVPYGKDGFHKYCCIDCAYKDEAHWERRRKTMIEHHGVEHPAQSPKILKKMMDTCVERYGVEHPTQSLEIVERRRRNWILDLGVEHPMKLPGVVEKRRLNNIKRLGVESPFQLESVRNKYIETCMERYGEVNSSKSPEIRDKLSRIISSREVSEKIIAANQERYGYDYYVQSPEFHKKCHKRYTNPKYPDMTFATSWEFKVYDFLTENHIEFEYQVSIAIPYEYAGKTHYYHPDFRVYDRIVEVKGDQFFRINEETGKEEMFMPWREPGMSDEEYRNACEKEEVKHQCMIANNVIILRKKDIDNLSLATFSISQ